MNEHLHGTSQSLAIQLQRLKSLGRLEHLKSTCVLFTDHQHKYSHRIWQSLQCLKEVKK